MRTCALAGWALVGMVVAGTQGSSGTAVVAAQGTGEAAIKQVADAYVKASLASDAKAVAALYTEDAVEMPPNQPPVKGRTAIEQHYAKLFAGGGKVGAFALTHLESRASGDLGYDAGTYQQTMTPPGQAAPMKDTGKYVVILKRVTNEWKVAYAIYNSDLPTPAR